MIYGIGTDIVAIARLRRLWEKHGERALERVLAPEERDACRHSRDPGRFLAKRFAAKEALAKALGTGVRPPVTLCAIAVAHGEQGKPYFRFSTELSSYLARHGLRTQISISDEREFAIAFSIVEQE